MTSNGSFPTIPEATASPATQEIYADIRSTMGVALVNLVWRHLAVTPTVLQWSWHALKPHYASGAVPAAAWLLREALETPVLPAFSREEQGQLTHEMAAADEIDAVFGTYERGNAQNLVAMCYLRNCLTTPENQSTVTTELSEKEKAAEQSDKVTRAIPPLPRWESLNTEIQNTITAMTSVWVPANYPGITPSVFRHISYWPTLLLLYEQRLKALQNSDANSISVTSERAIEHANRQALQLEVAPQNLPALSTEDQQWLKQALDLFIHGMISRGVVIVPAMRALLAQAVTSKQ